MHVCMYVCIVLLMFDRGVCLRNKSTLIISFGCGSVEALSVHACMYVCMYGMSDGFDRGV